MSGHGAAGREDDDPRATPRWDASASRNEPTPVSPTNGRPVLGANRSALPGNERSIRGQQQHMPAAPFPLRSRTDRPTAVIPPDRISSLPQAQQQRGPDLSSSQHRRPRYTSHGSYDEHERIPPSSGTLNTSRSGSGGAGQRDNVNTNEHDSSHYYHRQSSYPPPTYGEAGDTPPQDDYAGSDRGAVSAHGHMLAVPRNQQPPPTAPNERMATATHDEMSQYYHRQNSFPPPTRRHRVPAEHADDLTPPQRHSFYADDGRAPSTSTYQPALSGRPTAPRSDRTAMTSSERAPASPRHEVRRIPHLATYPGMGPRRSSEADQTRHEHEDRVYTLGSFMPSAWSVPENHPDVQLLVSPLRLVGRLPPSSESVVLVVTNKPIPMGVLQHAAAARRAARLTESPSHPDSQSSSSSSSGSNSVVDAYYFEITMKRGVMWIGLVPSNEIDGPVSRGRFPGDCRDSIGLSADGRLLVSGRRVFTHESGVHCYGEEKDTIGCGIELSSNGVFFTKNGKMLIPPRTDLNLDAHWFFPAVGIAAGGGDSWANFGLSQKFRWRGPDKQVHFSPLERVRPPTRSSHASLADGSSAGSDSTESYNASPNRPARFDARPRRSRPAEERPRPAGETTPTPDVGGLESPSRQSSGGSSSHVGSSRHSSHENEPVSVPPPSNHTATPTVPLWGKPSNNRLDEDESVMEPAPTPTVPVPRGPAARGPTSTPVNSAPAQNQGNHVRIAESAQESPTSRKKRVSDDLRDPQSQGFEDAKGCVRDLRACCANEHADDSVIENLLAICRSKQKAVTATLESPMIKFDDREEENTIMQLLSLNEDLLGVITSAEAHLEGGRKQRPLPGPLPGPLPDGPNANDEIDSLVKKKDVFSLICLLRAQGEKRLESALALLRFAREADSSGDEDAKQLRNEIRSSGGMHSFLALFRMKGATRELKVVAALAVAYLLPSFVESTTVDSSSLGLKMVECLRFLFSSRPVSPRGQSISRDEMCSACATGVLAFWVSALSPMLSRVDDPAPSFADTPTLVRRPSLGRTRNRSVHQRAGGGVFDQRQEVLELQELLEMTVSLIVGMAKVSDSNHSSGCKLHLRYTLVEQLCDIDVARPIAVREGLLKVLVGWMRSDDDVKIGCATTSVNELTSTKNSYMAGWIHSQIVNEGALAEIVRLSASNRQNVRLAVAEILSSLCVAPHTRAAVVEAQSITCLVNLLYDYGESRSQNVALAAGRALLQLVTGAMTRASVIGSDNLELDKAASPDKRDKVIFEVVNGGAICQFVELARSSKRGELRAMSVEALRVISEDTSPFRETRLRLCGDHAPKALGIVMSDDIEDGEKGVVVLGSKNETLKELHQALCTWANILDEPEHVSNSGASVSIQSSAVLVDSPDETVIRGCIQFVDVGGLRSLLMISTLPFKPSPVQDFPQHITESDLVVEACRSLASLSPLLLSSLAASEGYAAWTSIVLRALINILKNITDRGDINGPDTGSDLQFDALRGIGVLAQCEPHKMTIVDNCLPFLFHSKASTGDSADVADAAGQVCLSLGLADEELATQVAGNDSKLMGDWFCLNRSLLIQSMAREEVRKIVEGIWKDPFDSLLESGSLPAGLGRSTSKDSATSGQQQHTDSESGGELRSLSDVFVDISASDKERSEMRNTVLQHYHDVYENESVTRGALNNLPRSLEILDAAEESEVSGLLSSHVYPLDSPSSEKEWILSHRGLSNERSSTSMTKGVQNLLDCCIPSRAIQNDIMPVFDLCPDASFDFRTLLMPQRRYFSFRREGQLISRLCDTNAALVESDDVHWSLGFTNSSFAGEFSETVVQALYRCPLIRGISFTRNENCSSIWASESDLEGQDSSSLLANLAGSLPPWVSCVIYDNTLNDFAIKALSAILETMGKLSASQGRMTESDQGESDQHEEASVGKRQGSFRTFAVRNSPYLSADAWKGFFSLLGRTPGRLSSLRIPPLSSLRLLDLSGNELGDEPCAFVLERILDEQSGSSLEQLDLSRNRIRRGDRVTKALQSYVSHHRRDQRAGVKMGLGSWKSPLAVLNLGSNELNVGELSLEVVDLLKHNALSLRSLDLSDNGLQCEGYNFTEVLIGAMVKNTCMRHLNLSRNNFSSQCINRILQALRHSDVESGLAFLRFEGNDPPLTDSQQGMLNHFTSDSRRTALKRYLHEKERSKHGEPPEVDYFESPMAPVLERRQSIASHGTSSIESVFSGSALWSTSEDSANKRRPSIPRPKPAQGQNMITVLFSAPLVFQDDRQKLKPFAKLDFDMERELLWQCLKEARRDIDLQFDNATRDRLLAAETKRCSCLHYSGHGHQSHLPFEDGKGGPHWLEVKVLKDLIYKSEGAPFKFVFVSACYSGLAGETFASAGVPHVVCCQQESELKDSAALAFTRQFYLALAVGRTVKESFDQGCKAVRATPGLRDAEHEMKKFILLPKHGNHDVPVFDARPVRMWPRMGGGSSSRSLSRRRSGRGNSFSSPRGGARGSELSVRNMMQEDPSPTPPQSFIGREVDMFHVLNHVIGQRLVSVVGETGVGRSSLVYAVCHYINERSSTITMLERIYYAKAAQSRGSDRFVTVLRSLLRKLAQDGRAEQHVEDDMDKEILPTAICDALKNVKALVVIDRTEFLEGSDEAQDLVMFLGNIFRETRTVRVLLTGRQPLGIPSIGGVAEQPYELGPLNFHNTVRLFASLCPHLHTPVEREAFYARLVTDGDQADVFPGGETTSGRTARLFEALGDGIPSRAEKAAYSVTSDELIRLGEEEDDSVADWESQKPRGLPSGGSSMRTV